MAKHSPGPYVVCTNNNEPNVLFIEQDAENLAKEHGEPSVIGEVYLTGNGIDEATGRANATLWASAPDMLAFIESFCTAYAPDDGGETSWEALNDILETALEIRQRFRGT